ncbi:gluconate 5-dehydrogenase [Metarhizium robertsii]|uniref:Hydroxynaphthalene reductase-like protein Arp2 n=1 Tax=Metarhizium robertsii TaxID=568076 RepID=A0A0A1UY28_9HYPO|nr:gluconate 5-dehydrogenase [Metarhizium robertsii]
MDVNTLFGVQGKVVLITGGAKGIGRMIATGFVTNGAKVYITGRDAPACHAAVADLEPLARLSGSIHALPANLQNLDECQALAAELARLEPGGLHVLVNNAGATWGADIDSHPDAAWTKLLTLNLQRAFTLTQLCLPLLERAGSQDDPARVIHVGSIDGVRVPSLANYAYSASKAGLHHLSRHLARDLGFRNVTSNVLACGPFRTKMMKATLDAAEDVLKENIPLRRIGRDEDVAGSAIFLASKAG